MANYAWFTKLHRFVYHRSGGRIGQHLGRGRLMVLMYTIGARSGQLRAVPLQYYPVTDDGIVVIASNNGHAKHPAWYYNLKAHPEIDVLVGRERRRVCAQEVDGARRALLWPKIVAINPQASVYSGRAAREIPVVLLRTPRPP